MQKETQDTPKEQAINHKAILTKYIGEVNGRHRDLPADVQKALAGAGTKGKAKGILRDYLQQKSRLQPA